MQAQFRAVRPLKSVDAAQYRQVLDLLLCRWTGCAASRPELMPGKEALQDSKTETASVLRSRESRAMPIPTPPLLMWSLLRLPNLGGCLARKPHRTWARRIGPLFADHAS